MKKPSSEQTPRQKRIIVLISRVIAKLKLDPYGSWNNGKTSAEKQIETLKTEWRNIEYNLNVY